jgi:dihydrofolate synthase / folylpolyglutamate synthase
VPLSLPQWLAHQAQAHPQAIDLGLERLRRVQELLGWQQPTVPVITVAGTNGKGSVSGYCAAILTAAGYRVGTFTSPHLRDYRERIRVHDSQVSADELVAAFERIENARGDVGLTFFEYNALAALLVFEAANLDAWVLEIGMGGRLDAVNVVDPDVSVVVSIGMDHQEYLGATLDAIAREKAGIFRRGRPAVLGSREMPAAIAQCAAAVGARLKRPGIEYSHGLDGDTWHYRGSHWNLDRLPPPALLGSTQYANAATAIAALEEIHGRLAIPAAAVARGLQEIRLVARFQVIRPAKPELASWVLDVAHNPDAARVLANNLRESRSVVRTGVAGGRTLAVCGILADKDAAGIATELRDCIDAWWCVPTEGERGRSAASLAQVIASQVTAPVKVADSLDLGCAAAMAAATREDRIVVFGSFHVVGPALDWLEAHDLLPPATLPEYTAASGATYV